MNNILKNKRGDLTGIFYLIIMISAFAIFLLIIGYVVPQIVNPMKAQMGISTLINNSFDSSSNITYNTFPSIWLIMFAGLTLGLFITAFLMQTHPIFVPIFIIGLIVAIIIAVPLSNAYESLANDATLAPTSNYQTAIKFIMLQLPLVTFIIGLIIMIVTFAKPGGNTTLA